MNASGAYWTLSDKSFKTNGSSSLIGIVPMCTVKGSLKELNLVTAETAEDIIGYDLAYNGNYLGLQKMLNAVSYLYVMRINKDPYVANIYDVAASAPKDIWKIGSVFYNSDLSVGTEPTGSAGTAVTLGSVYIATAEDTALEAGVWYSKEESKWYKVTALTTSALTLGDEVTDAEAIAALEAAATSPVSYVPYTEAASIASYPTLEDGASLEELVATVAFQLNYAGKQGRHFVKLIPHYTKTTYDVPEVVDEHYVVGFESAISLDARGVKVGTGTYAVGVYDNNETLIAVAGGDGVVHSVTGDIVGEASIGTVTTSQLTLNSADITFSGSTFVVDAYVTATQLYTLVQATSEDGNLFQVVKSTVFNLNEDSEYYYKNQDFGEIVLTIPGNSINYSLFQNYTELLNGSNGTMPTASDIDFAAFDKSPANVCVLMGMTNVSLCNAFIQQGERRVRSSFVGAPELSTFAAVKDWASTLYASEFRQLAWISDIEETSVGDVYISPAVNLFLIYAQMLSDYGNLNYPPAGYSYGNIAVTKLMDTDFDLFRDELKTDKINYQWIGPRGAVMWEQRTGYPDETDLAYANTVFIMRDLRSQLLDFAITKTFRYTSPSDLTTFGKGVDDILRGMKDAGFLAAYSLKVPTFAEAQASGRKTTIKIGVAITQDSEEIWFDVVLNNYSDIAA